MGNTAQYICTQGQSWSDVVLNTYATMDLYVKLLNDNGLQPEVPPNTGQKVFYDPSLINDQTTTTLINNQSIVYATAPVGYFIPTSPQQNIMSKYQQTQPQATYTASVDGETSATITGLIGGVIVSVTKEQHPLLSSDYSFVQSTGVITLLGGLSLAAGETLFIIFTQTQNTQ